MKTLRYITLTSFFAVLLAGCNFFPTGVTTSEAPSSSAAATTSIDPTTSTSVVPKSIETQDRFKVDGTEIGDYYHNVWYADETTGLVTNTYKEGGANYNSDTAFNVNNGKDYNANPSKHNYDLIIPDSVDKNAHNKVILLIHGGAWIGGNKDDMQADMESYAKDGYIVANMLYTLLPMDLTNLTLGIGAKDCSVYRMLDEIDATITSLKAKLVGLNFDGSKLKLVMAGVSAGSHIMMLYAYSRGAQSAIDISFLVDAVGPVDIKVDSWKEFIVNSASARAAGIEPATIAASDNVRGCTTHFEFQGTPFDLPWTEYKTMMYADSMCGSPYAIKKIKEATPDEGVTVDMSNEVANKLINKFEDTVSVTHYIDDNDYPIIMGYGGNDDIVGIGQYAKLEPVLAAHSVEREFFYFENSGHELGADSAVRTAFDAKISEWLVSK